MSGDRMYFGELTPSTPYLGASGRPLAGATLTFDRSGTNEHEPVYSDESLAAEHTLRITADSDGVFWRKSA